MKQFKVRKLWRESQFSSIWHEGTPIIIDAKNLNSAKAKAEKMWSVYTHYEVVEEIPKQ